MHIMLKVMRIRRGEKMFLYLASQESSEMFDFVKVDQLLNVKVKKDMTGEQLFNFMKTDLRNVEIEYFILDTKVLKKQTFAEVKPAFETFQVFNPESQVILCFENKPDEDSELEQWILEAKSSCSCGILFFDENMEEQLDSILHGEPEIPEIVEEKSEIEETVPEKAEEQEEEQESEEPESVLEKDIPGLEEPATMEEDPAQEVIERPEETVIVAPNNMYSLTQRKLKTHEGIPLKKLSIEEISAEKEQMPQKQPENVLQPSIVHLKDCLSEKSKRNWTCSNIVIAVVGFGRRTGATTAAFHLCSYLNQARAKVAYSEAVLDKHAHLKSIADEYEFKVQEGCYSGNGITFYPESVFDENAGYNFIIFDLGSFQECPDWINAVVQGMAQEVVLVSGTRKYETEGLEKCLEGFSQDVRVLFQFTDEERMERLKAEYGRETVMIYRGQYEPELFRYTDFEEMYGQELLKYNSIKS